MEEAEEDEEVEEKEKAPPANQVESLDPLSLLVWFSTTGPAY